MSKDLKFEAAIKAFLKMMCYVENSKLISYNDSGDYQKIWYVPIHNLASIYKELEKDKNKSIGEYLDRIAKNANLIWYAIDCRTDIRTYIPNIPITIDGETKKTLLSFLRMPLNTELNIDSIHDIAGRIDILIKDED